MLNVIIYSTLFCTLLSCKQDMKATSPPITKSEIVINNGRYTLLVNGEPYYIKGAGLEFGSIPKLAEHGGNTFRTWRTDNGQRSALEILDEAQANGLKVFMGIEVARERHGFNYNDTAAVRQQLEDIRRQVMELKDHPALIIWGIGNELNLRATNPKVWDAVNDISAMIHQIDTNHLTTTSLAGINSELITYIKQRASDLDFLSVQMYADIINLPKYIDETGWDGPFVVTEWGATGHWEVPLTDWKAPIENNSTVKADFYAKRYREAIETQTNQCLGSFVFLWGQKQERTPTWYGLFLEDGQETASVDAMHYIWNGTWPENRSPRLDSITLNNKVATDNIYLSKNTSYMAESWVSDPDQDSLSYEWIIMHESRDLQDGGDFETTPEAIPGLLETVSASSTKFKAPDSEGAYRLFLYVTDNKGHAAHANIPFFVK